MNRGPESRVFLRIAHWDDFWLRELEREGWVRGHTDLGLADYFARYRDRYRAAVIYDPDLPASINVATMTASLEDGVVVSPEDKLGLGAGKTVIDLRGRWRTNAEAYNWAIDELWPSLNHEVLCCYHPTACRHMLRDFLVRNRVFTMWVTGKEAEDGARTSYEAERAALERLLALAPTNIPVIGFWYSGKDPGINEYAGVGLAGEYGKFTVPCDLATNTSLLSGVKVDIAADVRDYRSRTRSEVRDLRADRVYIAFVVIESGDAASYLENRQWEVWADPRRGEIPVNWGMGPGALDLVPPVAAWYFRHATANDYVFCALSGAGYTHPYRSFLARTPDPEAAWTRYLELTAASLDRLGCHEIGLYIDAWLPFDRAARDPITRRFAEIPGVEMLVLGMGRDEGVDPNAGNYPLGTGGALASHVMTRWPLDYSNPEANIRVLVEDIRAHTPTSRPGFMVAMALSWAYGPTEIAKVLEALGEDYVPVTLPDYRRLVAPR